MNLPDKLRKNSGNKRKKKGNCLWVYNYDFEFEMAGELKCVKNQALFHPWFFLNRSWHVMLPLAGDEDSIVVYGNPHPQVLESLQRKLQRLPRFLSLQPGRESNAVFDDLAQPDCSLAFPGDAQLCPWGWSPKARSFAQNSGLSGADAHNPAVIEWSNAKTTSHCLRQTHLPPSFGIPGLVVDISMLDRLKLESVADDFRMHNGRFRVKHPFGSAGRLSDKCDTGHFSEKKIRKWENWIRKTGSLLLEKSISILNEWSVQVYFDESGEVLPIAMTRLFSGPTGNYLGTIVTESDQKTLLNRHMDALAPVFHELVRKGYVGPLGIDLIEDKDGGFRLLEINGRLTMGRIAFEWHRMLAGPAVSFFTNLFVAVSGNCDEPAVFERLVRLVQISRIQTTVLNLVPDRVGKSMMVSLLIQGDDVASVQAGQERIRNHLKQEFRQG